MSFLQIKKKTIYLSVTNQPKLIRPLSRESIGKWVHTIPSCSIEESEIGGRAKNKVLRFFKQIDADSTSWLNDNQDPLWDKLDKNDKYNRNGERQDFPVRPLHLLPVFDYEENDVKIARYGNQFYEDMTKYYDQGGDVCSCDWICWTEGSSRKTEYKMTRQDASPFNYTGDINLLMQKAQELMQKAQLELTPFKNDDDLIKYIYGQDESNKQLSPAPSSQPNRQLPQYTQGGSVNIPLGGVPSSVPQQPMAQIPQQSLSKMPHMQQPQPQPQMQQPQMQPSFMPPFQPLQASPQILPQTQVPMQSQVPQMQPQMPMQTQQPQMPMQPQMQVPIQQFQHQPVIAQYPQVPSFEQQQPVQTQVAPVVQTQNNNSDPYNFMLDFGKHSGKTLGWILENDKPYLSYLKGNKRELAAIIDSVLSVVTNSIPAQTQANTQNEPAQVDNGQRSALLDAINQKMINIADFQGPGIAINMMPFLVSIIGTTDFSNAHTNDLIKLSNALDQKLSQQ